MCVQLWSAWLPGFEYVLADEAGRLTSTYEAFFPQASDLAPNQPEVDTEIVAFETYASEPEFERVHMGSPIIKKFLGELTPVLGRETTLNFLEASGKGFHTRSAAREAEVKQSGKKPFTLIVTVTFKADASVDPFLAAFGDLAAYVLANEPNTITYEAFRSKNHPAELIIFERYIDKADLTTTHANSDAYKAFVATTTALGTVTSLTMKTYEEQQKGVWGAQ